VLLSNPRDRPEPRPEEYRLLLTEVSLVIAEAATADNSARTQLYWNIGKIIHSRLDKGQLPAVALQWLSDDLQRTSPAYRGLSLRNLQYMRKFATLWSRGDCAGRGTMHLPWGHVTVLLDKLADPSSWPKIAEKALREQWSRATLMQVCTATRSEAEQKQDGRADCQVGAP
jgi:hypothetical protein